MDNFLRFIRPHTICLCSTLITFSMTITPKIQAFELESVQMQVGIKEIVFGIKIGKLIEKIKKYQEKLDQQKMLETMIELKMEVEAYIGKKINIDKELDRVEREMIKDGAKFREDEFNKVRKVIKQADNRGNHKALYMADCLTYGIDYNAELEHLSYIAKHGNDKEKDAIPLRVTVGVTIALCGFFLMFVPLPICQANGPWIAQAGLALAVDGTITRVEENNRK